MSEPHENTAVEISATLPSKWISGLSEEMSVAEALPRILQQRWEAVQQALPLASELGRQDPEAVHKLRVACRRMAAVLKTFDRVISRKARNYALKLIGRIRRKCGTARDLDVQLLFLANLLPHVPPEATPGVGLIREELLRHRSKAQEKLQNRLEAVGNKLTRCEQLIFQPGRNRRKALRARESFGSYFSKILHADIQEIRDETPAEGHDRQALHPLRVACKNLRYAAEISSQVLHPSFREELYPRLQHVQDLLGTWNDAIVTEANLSRLRRKWKRQCDGEGQFELRGGSRIGWREMQIAFDAAREACHRQAERALLEFRRVWPEFVGKTFCQPVLELLTSMQERAAEQSGQDKPPRSCRLKTASAR